MKKNNYLLLLLATSAFIVTVNELKAKANMPYWLSGQMIENAYQEYLDQADIPKKYDVFCKNFGLGAINNKETNQDYQEYLKFLKTNNIASTDDFWNDLKKYLTADQFNAYNTAITNEEAEVARGKALYEAENARSAALKNLKNMLDGLSKINSSKAPFSDEFQDGLAQFNKIVGEEIKNTWIFNGK